ncbi:MATE family efflux transporter [Metabacillus litoralis]|uniref:MATE family efflux transporter n=1 Tax=Metabacillus litoralis TaxID=152268 RepID=UPI00203ABD9B|nr:MATE family efflux transporter [Metabacillus litoralis]MCM3160947.1 MATE family efflux transporter [Metabacillus litoralis]MCM3412006.1 MATE family efflux transporter [Metabacillus litoralis]
MAFERQGRKITLFALTWPIFIETLLHMLMGNADTLMLSQYSDNSVAAVGVSNQILFLLIVMFGFIATGTTILVAQYIGGTNYKDAKEVSTVSLSANLLFSILISVVIVIASEDILQLMNLPPELMPDATIYLQLVGGFSFVQALIMTSGAILKSYGYTKDTMYLTIGMNLLNIIGNYFFIFGPFGFPVLGVQGVAISTVVSRIIGLFVILYILKKRVHFTLNLKELFKLPVHHLKNLLHIGVPTAGEQLSYNTSQMVITVFITMIGTEALTTKVYAQNLMMLILLFSLAVSQGTQILVGYMIGAKDYEAAYKRCLQSLYSGIIISTLMAVIFSLFSDRLLGIFTSNERILEVGGILILLTIILEPGRAFNMIIISSLRATGDIRFPTYVGILSMWGVAVPIAYILGIHFDLGLVGVWIAFIADEWVRGIIMLYRWKSRAWMTKRFSQHAAVS